MNNEYQVVPLAGTSKSWVELLSFDVLENLENYDYQLDSRFENSSFETNGKCLPQYSEKLYTEIDNPDHVGKLLPPFMSTLKDIRSMPQYVLDCYITSRLGYTISCMNQAESLAEKNERNKRICTTTFTSAKNVW